jgi:hypothetical protein
MGGGGDACAFCALLPGLNVPEPSIVDVRRPKPTTVIAGEISEDLTETARVTHSRAACTRGALKSPCTRCGARPTPLGGEPQYPFLGANHRIAA